VFLRLSSGLALLASSAAVGQLTDPMAAESASELPEFEVTATHFALSNLELPLSVEVLGREELSRFASFTVPEALKTVSGIHVRNSSGSPADATIDLRGQGESAGRRVLILVDGRRLNSPDLSGINWLQIPTAQITRIEILKGGQGVIYGDQAIGGVIKITTRQDTQPGIATTFTTGSWGQRQASLEAQTNVGANHAISAGAIWLEQDGYREWSAYAGRSLHFDWRYESDFGRIRFHLQENRSTTQLPGPIYSTDFPEDPRISTLPGQENELEQWGFDLSWESPEMDWGQIVVPLNYSTNEKDWTLLGAWGSNNLDTIQLRPRWRMEWERVALISGVDGLADRLDFTGFRTAERVSPLRRADLERDLGAIYLHAEVEISDALRFSLGGRQEWWKTAAHSLSDRRGDGTDALVTEYDESRTASGQAASLGLVYQPSAQWRLWSRYDRVFRFPVLDEMASYQGYQLPDPFNVNLDPETGHTAEIGFGWGNATWNAQLVAFGQRMDNEIDYDPTAYTNANLPAADRWGLESTLRYDTEKFRAEASWTHTEARIREGEYEGKTPPLTPSDLIRVSVNLKPHDRVDLGVAWRYTSRQFEGNYLAISGLGADAKFPSSAVTDFSLHFRLKEGLSLRAVVENVFDSAYATVKYQGGWYPASGRSWRLQLSANF
jgi:iron complex outermembrane receptor protein